ncbi:MAG: DNA polymerase III subunit chi [Pseudomonadota bacterium]
MTQISFHVNVPDALPYACRLLRKAYRVGARVVVTGPQRELQQLDKLLWTFEPLEFVPHVMVHAGAVADASVQAQRQGTPIWLMAQLTQDVPAEAVVLNVGEEPPEGVERFARMIDIVPAAEAQRDAGRRRWKHYLAAGHSPEKHEVAD